MGAEEAAQDTVLKELVNRPLSEIAQEIDTLRQENALLKTDITFLKAELAVLSPVSMKVAPLARYSSNNFSSNRN